MTSCPSINLLAAGSCAAFRLTSASARDFGRWVGVSFRYRTRGTGFGGPRGSPSPGYSPPASPRSAARAAAARGDGRGSPGLPRCSGRPHPPRVPWSARAESPLAQTRLESAGRGSARSVAVVPEQWRRQRPHRDSARPSSGRRQRRLTARRGHGPPPGQRSRRTNRPNAASLAMMARPAYSPMGGDWLFRIP
jgi:hypothetical protein